MPPFLIIKTGSTFPDAPGPGDFEHWTARAMGVRDDEWACRDMQNNAEALPALTTNWSGAVITGSHDMVTDRAKWMERAADELRELTKAGIPMLGICFGHQLLADALGGKAGFNPRGLEAGTVEIRLTEEASDDPIFSGLPPVFPGHATHSQSALALPENAILLAENDHEPHHAFRVGRHAWGVQFHPEFNETACRHYVLAQKAKLEALNRDADTLAEKVRPTPDASSLLRRFVDYCRKLD